MSFEYTWLNDKGFSVKEGIAYTGGEEKYISAIQRYYKNYESNVKTVRDALASGDIEGYCIKVHAIKSNSKMIGAKELGKAFEELELASKNNDMATVNAKTEPTLLMYKNVIETLRPIGEMEAIQVSGEIGAEEAKETADKLLEALDDFDDELSKELAEKLRGYPFRFTQKERLKEAINYISDFSYDEAAEIIKEIIPAIE